MWIPRPRFAYSLYNFYGATIKIKGSLLKSIASVMRFLLNSLGQISTFLGEKLATGPYSIISIQLTWSFSQNFSLMSGLISICGFTFWYTEPYTQHHRHDTRVSSDVRFDLNLWFHLLIHWTLHTTSQTWHTCIKCCQVWSQSVVSPSDTLNPTHNITDMTHAYKMLSGLISICGFTFWYTEPYTHNITEHDTRV